MLYHKRKIMTNHTSYSKRTLGVEIDTIILHYTALGFKESLKALTKSGKVSSHFLINEDGEISQLVPLEYKAWHAGESFWKGKRDINRNSIGIEIVNPGMQLKFKNDTVEVAKKKSFSNAQYFALSEIITAMKQLFPKITNANIIGHSDITAKTLRKVDPGFAFDWRFLHTLGHGIYHDANEHSQNEFISHLNDSGTKIELLQKKLKKFGYEVEINGNFDKSLANVLFAFNLHYNQQSSGSNNLIDYGKWSKSSEQILNKLF